MEAIVGSALLSSTAGASTVGLLGAGGVFAPAAGSIAAGIGSIGTGSLLSGILTGAGAFGQMQAGNMQQRILNLQAQQSELNARMEGLKGRQQALNIKNQLDRDLASQNATFAARGVLQGEGSAAAAAESSKKNAQDDIDTAMFGAEMGAASDRLQASQFRAEGKAAKTAGRVEAISSIASYRPVQSLLEGI